MDFGNSTALSTARLRTLIERATIPYAHDALRVRVRYSRGADFSGTCYYRDQRIFVNIGRHVRYPYRFATHLAKARGERSGWRREAYYVTVADGYQLALFVYLHELYHHLVAVAGRSPRRKEAMCDRFAARVLVDDHAARVTDSGGRAVERATWDFQDLDRFVARAPRHTPATTTAAVSAAALRPIPVRILGR